MVKMAVKLEKIGRQNENSIEILKDLAEQLGDGVGRVEFKDIEKRTKIPRATISSTVKRMIQAGTVELIGDALSVRNAIVWYEEA